MKDKIIAVIIRALRTFIQTALGIYLAGLAVGATLGDISDVALLEAAAAAGIVAVLWNFLEELKGVSYNRG